MTIEEIRKNAPKGAQYAVVFSDWINPVYFKDRNKCNEKLSLFSNGVWIDAMGEIGDLNPTQYDLVLCL